MFVIYVPLAFLGRWLYGLEGIFLAACASNLTMGVIAFTWNRRAFAAGH
ncbi:MAG: hypothetical protein U5O39_15810 [Gammaproteobacteria bacterium]|nr:hypothetical protein [Gammaproteobacteria bacterium]